MKQILALMLAVIMLLLCACTTPDTNPENTSASDGTTAGTTATTEATTSGEEPEDTATAKKLTLAKNGKSDYRIITPSFGGAGADGAAAKLCQMFKEETGIQLPIETDFFAEECETEILIGLTKRSPEVTLEENQVYVSVSGERIVILAGKADLLTNAVDFFFDKVKAKSGTVTVPGDLMAKKSYRETLTTFTVASFNLHNGVDVDYDYRILANDILATGADIIGLQEVDKNTDRNHNQDTLALLSAYTGYEYYCYAPTISPFSSGQYGIGILSKYPILDYEYKMLPKAESDPGEEQRGVVYAQIDINGDTIHFFNTHCGGADIPGQFDVIAEWTKTVDSYLVTGDFNYWTYPDFYSRFPNSSLACNEKNGLKTCGSVARDNIVYSDTNITISLPHVYETENSDHNVPVATFTKRTLE